MFFAKPRVKMNICNDKDEVIYYLYKYLQEQPQAIIDELEIIPIHRKIFREFKETVPPDNLQRVVRYLYLSMFSLYGSMNSLGTIDSITRVRQVVMGDIKKHLKDLRDVIFLNLDYRDALKAIAHRSEKEKATYFLYADPPYHNTYSKHYDRFTEAQTIELIEVLTRSGYRFAMSEFDCELIRDAARQYNLELIPIIERPNINKRRREIILVNYPTQTLFSTL